MKTIMISKDIAFILNKSNKIQFRSPAVYVRKGWQFCRPTLALTSKISYCLWDTKPQSQNDKREISKVREKFKRINAQVGATHRLSSQCTPIVCTYMYTMQYRQTAERDEKPASKKKTYVNIIQVPIQSSLLQVHSWTSQVSYNKYLGRSKFKIEAIFSGIDKEMHSLL